MKTIDQSKNRKMATVSKVATKVAKLVRRFIEACAHLLVDKDT
jgi:hypothetical protein